MKIFRIIHDDEYAELKKTEGILANSRESICSDLTQCAVLELIKFVLAVLELGKDYSGALDIFARIAKYPSLERAVQQKIVFSETLKASFPSILDRYFAEHNSDFVFLSLDVARNRFPNSNNLSIGFFTQHPCDSKKLTLLEHFHKNLALEKDDELIMILGQLGAKRIEISEESNATAEGKAEAKVQLAKGAGGSVGVTAGLSANKSIVVEFEGNSTEIPQELLQNSLWFKSDSRLLSIFEGRLSRSNKMLEYELVNSYNVSFGFDFSLVAKIPGVVCDFSAEFSTVSNTTRRFHVTFSKPK